MNTERLLVEFGNYLFEKYDVQVYSNDGKNTPLYQRQIHDADIKNFEYQLEMKENPAKYSIGDEVNFYFGDYGIQHVKVIKISITNRNKVQYDLELKFDMLGDGKAKIDFHPETTIDYINSKVILDKKAKTLRFYNVPEEFITQEYNLNFDVLKKPLIFK